MFLLVLVVNCMMSVKSVKLRLSGQFKMQAEVSYYHLKKKMLEGIQDLNSQYVDFHQPA